MTLNRQQLVRTRAYAIWEEDGRPRGKALAHWLQAQTEIDSAQLPRARKLLTSCIRSARQRCIRLTACIILLIGAWAVIHRSYHEWYTTAAMPYSSSCDFHPPDDVGDNSRLIDLNILSPEPREPVFDGNYVVNLGKTLGKDQFLLKITASSKSRRNYGYNDYMATLHWDDRNNLLWMTPEKMWFITTSSSHYMFPFDSSSVDEILSFDPPIDIKGVHLTNRVPDFYLPCNTFKVLTTNRTAAISFELRRNPIIPYTAVLLLVVAVILAIGITLFVETRSLPAPLAAFFFGVWSIRQIFGLAADSFPTIFDLSVILLVAAIPVLLILRILGLPEVVWPLVDWARKIVRMVEGRAE